MPKNKKFFVSIFAFLTLAALLLLSSGLTGVELLPGDPFPFNLSFRMNTDNGGYLPGGESILMIVRIIYLFTLILFPFAVLMLIISPRMRKEFFEWLKRVLPFVLMLILIYWAVQRLAGREEETDFQGPALPENLTAPNLGADFAVPNPPSWLVLVVSLIIVILFLAVVVGIVVYYWRRQQYHEAPVQRLAFEAREALDAIQSGANLRNAVLRCYYQMSRVVSEQRQLAREQAMTPREFEQRLKQHGLPVEPVRQLTRLFEQVRYGAQEPGELEEHQATASLIAILEACRSLS
jgi:hypothetical protein